MFLATLKLDGHTSNLKFEFFKFYPILPNITKVQLGDREKSEKSGGLRPKLTKVQLGDQKESEKSGGLRPNLTNFPDKESLESISTKIFLSKAESK